MDSGDQRGDGGDQRGGERIAAVRAKAAARYRAVLGDSAELAKNLELVTWNWAIRTCTRDAIPLYWDEPRFRYRYTTRVLGLEFNLKNAPGLRDRVMDRSLGVKRFVNMTPQEMYPEQWEQAYQKVAVRQLRRESDGAEDAPDGAYTCRRCKSKKTVYTAVQIRSADEPMTIFVTCLKCGKNWKD